MKEILNKEQMWFFDGKQYNTILSDDLDSLFSCALLKKYKGWNIGYFYDFSKLYEAVGDNDQEWDNLFYEEVAVDISVLKGKAIDNHVVTMNRKDYYNKESINLNLCEGIYYDNHTKKYCGSTLLEVISLLGLDITNWSEEQKMFILCIDSTFLGYHYKGGFYRDSNVYYLRKLGLSCLIDVESRHTQLEFEQMATRYGFSRRMLKGSQQIYVRKGKLKMNFLVSLREINELFADLGITLELPTYDLQVYKDFGATVKIPVGSSNAIKEKSIAEYFSIAFTYRGKMIATPFS